MLRPLIELPRDRREAGDIEMALTGRLLGLDSDIRVLRTEPGDVRSVTIRLSTLAFATLPAEAPPVVGLPIGIAAAVKLDRTRVEVRGPGERVAAAEAGGAPLRFAPIHLDGVDPALAAPREERIALRVVEGQLTPGEPVLATVTVKPARTSTVAAQARPSSLCRATSHAAIVKGTIESDCKAAATAAARSSPVPMKGSIPPRGPRIGIVTWASGCTVHVS